MPGSSKPCSWPGPGPRTRCSSSPASIRARRSATSPTTRTSTSCYTDIAGVRLSVPALRRQGDHHPRLPRLPARAPARHRALPAHASCSATTSCASRGTRCRTRRSSTRCTSTLPICHRDGQMVRTSATSCARRRRRAAATSASRTSRPQAFFMRERFIKSHFELVDHFIAPSDYVRDRYVDWGIPAEKVHGRALRAARRCRASARGAARDAQPLRVLRPVHSLQGRRRAARRRWSSSATTSTATCGSTARTSRTSTRSSRSGSGSCSETTEETVTFAGPYDHATELDRVMMASRLGGGAVDLVGDRAARGAGGVPVRRPVICSDIGGMSKKVTDGVNGLHFRTGDAEDLAEVMQRAVETPGLWEELQRRHPDGAR